MTAPQAGTRRAIAIVGMSGRFPGARSLQEFWHNIRTGVESLDTFTADELAAAGIDATLQALPGWVPRGTVLQDADQFDAAFFGYSPREAQVMDPQQRLFLECAWEAMEDAGYAGESDGRTVAIYAGSSLNSYVVSQLLPNRELLASVGGYQLMLGNDKDFLTTRASYKLDLHGPSMAIQTACSTSLVAVQVACQALLRGECDMALAGGVSVSFPQRTGYLYQEGMIFSPDGHCRPFDADAKGTRAGAGAGIVVLKRLDEALADGDTIRAVILGAAINNDGAGKAGYTAPSVDGQIDAIATAQALAGVAPESISYIEAHGTATPLGDPIEIAALTRVFRASTAATGICTIGSLKANLGHLDAAAGVAGLIKTVLALQHRELPPQLNFHAPNPQLELERSPFRVTTALEAWETDGAPRRAGVSSFGIGGTNAHVVLEEAPPVPAPQIAREEQLLVLSAKTASALETASANLAAYLSGSDAAPLAEVAYTLQVGRRALPFRRSVVARTAHAAAQALASPDRAPVVTGQHEGAARPVAFLFSGQGSQHAGMCAELYRTEEVFRAAVDRCAELLQPHLGRDVRELLWRGTDAELSETYVTQPVLFVSEYALAVLWMSWGVQPVAMLGHSIGEYVAAHLAGVFSLEDALMLVAARGRLMQGMAPGEMVAVRLAPAALREKLRAGVEIAAVNGPALCSVSGTADAIEALTRDLERDGIEHRPLHTSHAFHSAMMEPALPAFRELVSRVVLMEPRVPIVSNVTGTWLTAAQATSPDYWTTHLRNAVLFADGVATLAADPGLQLLEVGPGTALTSLARLTLGRDGAGRAMASLPHPREERSELDTMLSAAGRLWVAGVRLEWAELHRQERLKRVPLPTYPFERKRHWVDAPAPGAAAPAATTSFRRDRLDEWFYTPRWTRAPLSRTQRAAINGQWLVFGNGDALEQAVVAELTRRGATAVTVRVGDEYRHDGMHATVRAVDQADHERLIRDVMPRGAMTGIIHLCNAAAEPDPASGRRRALHAVSALGRALLLEAPTAAVRLVVATAGAQSVMGEAVTTPNGALSVGPILVLPAEHEGVRASGIDLDRAGALDDAALATALVDEAAADDADQFTAIRAGTRWARRFESGPIGATDRSTLPLTERGVYLVTGGLGGIGVTLAEWLASAVQARLILTARTALPERGAWDDWIAGHAADDPTSQKIRDIRRIEAAGGQVVVVAADVADVDSMRGAVQAVESDWGPVNGVIHAAGVAGDGLMALSSHDDVESTIRAKVAGLDTLVALFGDRALEVVLLCSSINVVGGVAGTFAYTAANAYLDAFAVSAARPAGWNAVSIAWDAWREIGMAPKVVVPEPMRAQRAAYVAAGIAAQDGAEAFARCLATGQPLHVVTPYDIERVLAERRRSRVISPPTMATAAPVATEPVGDVPSEGPRSSSVVAPTGDLETRLAAVWEDLLGVSGVGVHDNFFELGGHSLMATRVIARIDNLFGVRLPLREMFNAPTIQQLAAVIAGQIPPVAPPMGVTDEGEREEFEL